MNTLINVYWICLLLGFIWLAVQMFMSDFGHDFSGSEMDIPTGVDVHAGDADMAPADIHGGGEIVLSPISPTIISGFITVFGGAGIMISHLTKWGAPLVLFLAVMAGIAGGALLWVALSWIIRAVSGTSEARITELIGHEAEVITPIRGTSVGEIAYVEGGSRYNAPAKSIRNANIERNRIVKIVRIVGTTYFVDEIKDDELKTST